MKRALFLSTCYKNGRQPSSNKAKAILEDMARMSRSSELNVDTVMIEDLRFLIENNQVSIVVTDTGADIANYDVVYVKFWGGLHNLVGAIGIYLKAKAVKFICGEIANYRLEDKISEGILMATNDISYPDTVFSIDQEAMANQAKTWGYPFVIKAIDGQKGDDNYLVRDEHHLQEIMHDANERSVWLMAQRMVPNSGDYRVLCFGFEPKLIIKRVGDRSKTYLNNTSQGASAELVACADFPADALDACRKVSRLANREVAGVDVMFNDNTGSYVVLEVNYSPQLVTGMFVDDKIRAWTEYLHSL